MQFVCKCRRADDQRAVCLRGIHDFVVGADDRALVAIFSCQPLDHLVGTLASLGVNDVNSRTVLPVFDRLSPLPAVKDDRQCMAFAVPIFSQYSHQSLSPRI